jgi:hypothetical protein
MPPGVSPAQSDTPPRSGTRETQEWIYSLPEEQRW